MRVGRVIATPVIGLLLAACSVDGTSGSGEDFSVVKDYSTLGPLSSDSSLVVIGKVKGAPVMKNADEEGLTKEQVPIYEVSVSKGLKGKASSEVSVRLLGDKADADYPTLQVDRSYLLYLTAFEWHPGESTGEYVITGQQGAYELSGSRGSRVGKFGSLPKSVSLDDVAAQAR